MQRLRPHLGLRALRKDPLACLREVSARGDLVRIGHAPRSLFLVNHPDFIRHVLQEHHANYPKGPSIARVRPLFGNGLTTADGEHWRRQRRLLSPLFQPTRLQRFAPYVTEAAADLRDRWRNLAVSGHPIDIGAEMLALTRRVILRVLFGKVPPPQAAALCLAMDEAMEEVNRRVWSMLPMPRWLPTRRNQRLRCALWTLDEFMQESINNQSRHLSDPTSLLDGLLALDHPLISRAWIRDEVATALFAGHTTAAAALAWIWLLLDSHPEQERVLAAELRRMPADPHTAADLPAIPYTRMLIHEALRLYPPTWITARTALAEDQIGGRRIPAGSRLLLSPWAVHRHPAFWPDPERFDPQRFAATERDRHPSFAYLPFGGGPRRCIGQGFAMMEIQLLLAVLAGRYRVRLITPGPVAPEPAIVLRPPRGTLMRIEFREDAPGAAIKIDAAPWSAGDAG